MSRLEAFKSAECAPANCKHYGRQERPAPGLKGETSKENRNHGQVEPRDCRKGLLPIKR